MELEEILYRKNLHGYNWLCGELKLLGETDRDLINRIAEATTTSAIFTFTSSWRPCCAPSRAGRARRRAPPARLPFKVTSEIAAPSTCWCGSPRTSAARRAYPIARARLGDHVEPGDGYFVIPRAVELIDEGERVAILALCASGRAASISPSSQPLRGLDVILARLRARASAHA